MSNDRRITDHNGAMESVNPESIPTEVKRLVAALLAAAKECGCSCDPEVRVPEPDTQAPSYVAHDDWCAVWSEQTGGSAKPVGQSALRETGCTCHPYLATAMVPVSGVSDLLDGERVPVVKVLGHEPHCAINGDRN